ncbi:putative transcription factor Nin-like family [Helianthus annuus]|nr:putative transcription factor Nin-like family [Helianthus annuus]
MNLDISEFLQIFSPISLHHHHSEPQYGHPRVFWSESEGCENNSSSADLATTPMIHEMIKSALSNTKSYSGFFVQFWAPVTIDSRRLLSTSDQPFAVMDLSNNFAMRRLHSEKFKYNIDMNKLHIEPDHMILSGGPATAFLNCRASIDEPQGFLFAESRSGCVLCTTAYTIPDLMFTILKQTINCLQVTKDEIEEALKVVCESHNLALAQVWIPYEHTKGLSAIKLTGHLYNEYYDFERYFRFGDVTPRAIGEELPLVTLKDYESRYISLLQSDMYMNWGSGFCPSSAFAICLRSNDTGDFNYAFEFLWTKHASYIIFLEAILLTLKRCLPRFKFASGAEIGDELDVHNKDDRTEFKIFQRKRSVVVDDIAHSEVICKTTPKVLPREVIEKQFGKTMKEAAENLSVSLSTLKRKSKEHGISVWPGPKPTKRNRNDSSVIQINTNEEEHGAIEGISTLNLNKDVLTLKAEYSTKIIKLHLPISQATFVAIEKEIGMRLKLSVGTFELEYIDEDQDWISLTTDEDMNDCIQSSRKRMRVLPSPQPISGPSGSLGTFSV